ncbi:MAG: alanine racemase [Clostridium sp.]|nr:alanine racemase [Clostridium sp.]MDY3829206.1 alanine racemase [Clostridium sp.]
MEKIMRPVWAEINLDNIEYNIKNIVNQSEGREVIAVVKADAYGHGAIDIVDTLLENGVSRLAVAVITEGIELRKNNVNAPIMILGYTPITFAKELINYNIEQTVSTLEYAKELSKIAEEMHTKAKIHIALDTGMGRIGFIPNEKSADEVKEISKLKGIEIVGLFTHFSTADEKDKTYTNMQFEKLTSFIKMLDDRNVDIEVKHCSNSGAIIDMHETFLDAVRAGIILYGYYPSDDVDKSKLSIKPALTLKTTVSHIKEMDENMYISYGRTYKTNKKSLIATLPIGYADGYSRGLSGKAKVIVNGKFANIVGRICMDQCMIDVTDIGDVKIGDEVILLGSEGELKYDADDFAKDLNTINYEIICMLKQRVPRVYTKNGRVVSVRNYI